LDKVQAVLAVMIDTQTELKSPLLAKAVLEDHQVALVFRQVVRLSLGAFMDMGVYMVVVEMETMIPEHALLVDRVQFELFMVQEEVFLPMRHKGNNKNEILRYNI
jgi:hypothetical protein